MAEEELRSVLQGNIEFAKSLYQELATSDRNIFFSPINIHSVLTLLSQDPWFFSKQSFNHVLKVLDINVVAEHYKDILNLFNLIDDLTLLVANKAFIKDDYELQELFRTRLTNNYLYEINSLDFSKGIATTDQINNWIENKTFRKTKTLMDPSRLDGETRLMLLNAMHFTGKWAKSFNTEITVPATFYLNDNETIEVQMMKMKNEFYYKTDKYLDAKILELPYDKTDISLVVILPNTKTGIRSCENHLNFLNFTHFTEGMVKQEVDVSLPKFKIEETIELKQYLHKLGLEDAFTADLFGVIEGEDINLSKIQQKASIEINEEGSETATGMMSSLCRTDDEEDISKDGLVIYEMNMNTDISNRFAKTRVVWKIRNVEKHAKMVNFKVVLTETAFITGFVMEIAEKIYESYIKEKEVAKNIFNEAIAHGQSAGLVEATARDSKEFTVSVNIEPDIVGLFSLTYEEMLERTHDQYELILNICPGQIVQNLNVEVKITESRPLKFVKTPPMRSGNDISTQENEKYLDPSSEIQMKNLKTAVVKFCPDSIKQKKFTHYLGGHVSNGLSGQFIVRYDVEREPRDGEILLQDGYFVHFFAPNDLDPLPKHVVFVLDTSGSMSGRKMEQLKDAMTSILSELRESDMLNIIEFNNKIIVWDIDSKKAINLPDSANANILQPFDQLSELFLPDPIYATETAICNAKIVIQKMYACGSTFMIGGLQTALYLVKIGQARTAQKNEKCQPIIVFLTDGQPNVVVHSTEKIVELVTSHNKNIEVPIFSLSFGIGADKNFLRKLSLKNLGFSRHIYEAADASLQLQNFYKQISSPLLSDIKFKYDTEVEDVTRIHFPIYFRGSELVVCGRYKDSSFPTIIDCWGLRGPIIIRSAIERPATSLERLWAYLTVKQLLEKRDSVEDKTELTKKAVDLALKYSFVTDVTSLVVVKPNETNTLNTNQAMPPSNMAFQQSFAMPPSNIAFQQQQSFGSSGPVFGASGAMPPSNIAFQQQQSFGSSGPAFGASGGPSTQLFSAYRDSSGPVFGTGVGGMPSGQVFGAGGGVPLGQAFGASRGMPLGQAFGASGGVPLVQAFGASGGGSPGPAFGAFGGTSSVQGFGTPVEPSSVQGFGTPVDPSGQLFDASGGIHTGQSFSFGNPSGQLFGTSGGTTTGQDFNFGNIPLDMNKKKTKEFVADHPFLIFLQFKKENKIIILYQGRILKPI